MAGDAEARRLGEADRSAELAADDSVYLEQAETFFEHFAWIAAAMNRPDSPRAGLWDDEDGFFYDVLRLPDGDGRQMTLYQVRSRTGVPS